jgi:MFS transporter, OPA family, solute carrier family 37 (glycerol-3-phosphate transporter), member 1/2
VSVMANWFGKGKRGLIMGVWTAHTSVGNILGTVLAAAALRHGWGWSFLLPAALMAASGLLCYAFLVVHPGDVNLAQPIESKASGSTDDVQVMLGYLK